MPFVSLRTRLLAAIGAPATSAAALAAACGGATPPVESPIAASAPPPLIAQDANPPQADASSDLSLDGQGDAPAESAPAGAVAPTTPRALCGRDETRIGSYRPKFGVLPGYESTADKPCPLTLPSSVPDWPGVPMTLDREQTAAANPRAPVGLGDPSAVCDYTGCLPLSVARVGRVTCAAPNSIQSRCLDAPESGVSIGAAAPFAECPAGLERKMPAPPGFVLPARFNPKLSSKSPDGAAPTRCCYDVCAPLKRPVVGRPLWSGTNPVTALPAQRLDWNKSPVVAASSEDRLPDPIRAEHWLREAGFEHASIASFARLSLQLLALGAPPDLVAETHRAALDEIEHARISYALASAFGGKPLGPGALPIPPDGLGGTTLASLVRETLADGAINETIAALTMRLAAQDEREPSVAGALHRMAEDEERHAALAWRIVRWALHAGGVEVAGILKDERHRIASSEAADTVEARALREVVMPCLSAVLATAE